MSVKATLLWIYFWGVITTIMANTGTDWGLVVAWITLSFVVGGTFFGIGRHYCRKLKLRDPIEAYYESKQGNTQKSYVSSVSSNPQRCQVTLRTKVELNVQFIQLSFLGSPETPTITQLWDWQWNYPGKAHYINVRPMPDGSWYWEYDSPIQRRKGKRITIGIAYVADKTYQGKLEVGVTSNETDSNLCLDFKIENGE